jgi:cytidylate kinase
MDSTWIITIDGPAGSGKSTLARSLARALGWSFLDTGALYRTVALAVSESGSEGADPVELGRLARGLDLRVELADGASRVFLGEREVTELIRTPEISLLASKLSAIAEVRESLRAIQRRLGASGRLVTEGRDQGTAIFPEAKLKLFLTASSEARARRRALELKEKGTEVDILKVWQDIMARDRSDMTRETDPLREAPDAVRVDSTDLGLDGVLALAVAKAHEIFG